jgi:predicted DNA-binding transcriptional regulator YafY
MSKLETTKRYHLIINKLRTSKRASFAEIAGYLRLQSGIDGLNYNISLRTFQRDIQEIGSIFGIYIKFDFSGKYYFIEEEFEQEMSDRFFEAFDLFNALKTKENLSQFVAFDNRHSGGTEHIYGLLHAIRNRFLISFSYQKFYSNHVSERTVEPLALKEYRYRWYLFARDTYDERIKTYALDRFTDLQITNTHFQKDADFDIAEYLRYCFGVIVPENEKSQEIVLSFEPFQGKYIKSLPLHHSQKVLIDSEEELRISLQLYLTHDFIMELLSLGDTVKVIAPQELADELKEKYENALKNYL